MSTITVVTVDAGGNVPPALRIADELSRRGHRIEVLGHRRQADAVAGAGHAFRAVAAGGDFVLPGGEIQALHNDLSWKGAGEKTVIPAS